MNTEGDSPSPSRARLWSVVFQYIACYALWILICAIGMGIVFLIRRNLVEDIFFLRVNPWQLRAIDRWAFFGLGIVWVVAIFLIEGALRQAVEQGKLWRRAGWILLVQLVVVGISLLINLI